MIDLNNIYRRLARAWTPEELAACYSGAARPGKQLAEGAPELPARPIAVLATAIPPASSLSVAVHALHLLPNSTDVSASEVRVGEQLVETAARSAADALHRTQRALELDGAGHGYTTDEWLLTAYDMASRMLASARFDAEPPTIVQELRMRSAGCLVHWSSSTRTPPKPRAHSPRCSPAS